MDRIIDGIYIGVVDDIPMAERLNYAILGCCKEPLHRRYARIQGADKDGYTGRSMQKDEPEYLWAERSHALYLNLIDAREPEYIPDEVIDRAIKFIETEIKDNRDVLIVCNQGESRSPAIAFMYLIHLGLFKDFEDFWEAEQTFKYRYYPNYKPGNGMRQYSKKYWEWR